MDLIGKYLENAACGFRIPIRELFQRVFQLNLQSVFLARVQHTIIDEIGEVVDDGFDLLLG